jgi:hypothetical protein
MADWGGGGTNGRQKHIGPHDAAQITLGRFAPNLKRYKNSTTHTHRAIHARLRIPGNRSLKRRAFALFADVTRPA